MSKFILAGLVTLALAGCTGTIIGGGTPYGGYDRDTVSFIAARGPIPVRTVGHVGDLSAQDTLRAVTARFRLPGDFPPATFEAATEAQRLDGFHLTFVFDPERTPDVRTVCGPDPASIPTRAEVGKMRVVVGYCYRDEALNRVNARTPPVDPATPAFGAVLDQISMALFPVRDPNLNLDKRRRWQ